MEIGRLFPRRRAKIRSDLLDVSRLDLDRLTALPDSVLAYALRRVLQETERGAAAVAFQSSIAQEDL